MTSFVFRWRAHPELRATALVELRAQLPAGTVVTPKTRMFAEVDIPGDSAQADSEALQDQFGATWDILVPTYAALQPPRWNLVAMRKKLGR